MDPAVIEHLATASPAAAILVAWYLFARKHSEGLARLYEELRRHNDQVIDILRQSLKKDK